MSPSKHGCQFILEGLNTWNKLLTKYLGVQCGEVEGHLAQLARWNAWSQVEEERWECAYPAPANVLPFALLGLHPVCLFAAFFPRLPPDSLFMSLLLGPPILQVPASLCPCSLDSNLLLLCSSPPPDIQQETSPMGHSLGLPRHLPSGTGLNQRLLGHSTQFLSVVLFCKESLGNRIIKISANRHELGWVKN